VKETGLLVERQVVRVEINAFRRRWIQVHQSKTMLVIFHPSFFSQPLSVPGSDRRSITVMHQGWQF
jgi:hypothetical protein